MQNLSWTAGENPNITYVKQIGQGGYGQILEMRDSNGKHFARKVFMIMSRVFIGDLEGVENELRAFEDFLKNVSHPNIIQVFNVGLYKVPEIALTIHFIDMELCDLDLNDYIHQPESRKLVDGINKSKATDGCKFVTADVGLLSQAQNIWAIATDIANGLETIHSHSLVHRDLKPGNILYSFRDNAWKVTDFGYTAEAGSKQARTTKHCRGTTYYRAPEILEEKPTYTNKVDIWALGCILYEIACSERAFIDDINVMQYSSGKPRPKIPRNLRSYTLEMALEASLDALLAINPLDRPRATDIRNSFIEIGQLFEPFALKPSDDAISLFEWDDEETLCESTSMDLQTPDYDYLSYLYKNREGMNAAYEIWKTLSTSQVQIGSLATLVRYFAKGHLYNEQFDAAITAATELVFLEPISRINYALLLRAYRGKGDADLAIRGWKELSTRCKTELLQHALIETYKWRLVKGEGPIETWEQMLGLLPIDDKLKFQLVLACETEGGIDEAVANWEGLVWRNPYNPWLQKRLAGAYDRNGNPDIAIAGWAKLVISYPSEPALSEHLAQACQWKDNKMEEVNLVESLMVNAPDQMSYQISKTLSRVESMLKGRECWNQLKKDPNVDVPKLQEQLSEAFEISIGAPFNITLAILAILEDPTEPRRLLKLVDELRVTELKPSIEITIWEALFCKVCRPELVVWKNPHLLLGAYNRNASTERAIEGWRKLSRQFPEENTFGKELAEAYERNEAYENAVEAWEHLKRNERKNDYWRIRLAWCHEKLGNESKAWFMSEGKPDVGKPDPFDGEHLGTAKYF